MPPPQEAPPNKSVGGTPSVAVTNNFESVAISMVQGAASGPVAKVHVDKPNSRMDKCVPRLLMRAIFFAAQLFRIDPVY